MLQLCFEPKQAKLVAAFKKHHAIITNTTTMAFYGKAGMVKK